MLCCCGCRCLLLRLLWCFGVALLSATTALDSASTAGTRGGVESNTEVVALLGRPLSRSCCWCCLLLGVLVRAWERNFTAQGGLTMGGVCPSRIM